MSCSDHRRVSEPGASAAALSVAAALPKPVYQVFGAGDGALLRHPDAGVDGEAAGRAARSPGSGRARSRRADPRRAGKGGAADLPAQRHRPRGAPRKPATRRPALPAETSSSASTSVSGAIRNAASPISSARTPPGPNATSGPNSGSCTSPASSSTPPRSIGCTITGQPMRAAAAVTAASSRRSSATPPLSVLCEPAAALLTTTGKPELPRRVGRFLRRACVALRDERDAVRLEQQLRLVGVEPARRRRGSSARLTISAAAARSMPVELGDDPGRPVQPVGPLGGAAERAGRRFRVRKVDERGPRLDGLGGEQRRPARASRRPGRRVRSRRRPRPLLR